MSEVDPPLSEIVLRAFEQVKLGHDGRPLPPAKIRTAQLCRKALQMVVREQMADAEICFLLEKLHVPSSSIHRSRDGKGVHVGSDVLRQETRLQVRQWALIEAARAETEAQKFAHRCERTYAAVMFILVAIAAGAMSASIATHAWLLLLLSLCFGTAAVFTVHIRVIDSERERNLRKLASELKRFSDAILVRP